ncbi:MAG: HAMP domain-containing protein [Candidatus Omnitrophica bacterium]|nr:HAMP domain-containing protein [Candidatus Omnitrophota bacterium]
MKIANKIILGFLSIASIVGVVGTISVYQLNETAEPLKVDIMTSVVLLSEAEHLDEISQHIRYYDEVLTQSARNYAFTGNKKWKDRYINIEPELDRIIKEAIDKGSLEEKEFFASIDQANIYLVAMESEAIGLVGAGDREEAIEILESDEYWKQKGIYARNLKDYIRKRHVKYDQSLSGSMKAVEAAMRKAYDLIRVNSQTGMILTICAFLFAIGIGLFIARSISTPIIKLKDAAAEISKGKLNAKVDIRSKDEIGFLGEAFNQMIGHLKSQQERAEKRTHELTALYEVSNSIPYTTDYQQLLKLMMESVFKIIDYDICGALLFNKQTPNIVIKPSYPESVPYVDEVREALLGEFSKFCNKNIDLQPENVRVVPVESYIKSPKTREFKTLKSSFNAPLLIGGKIIGVLNFSSVQEDMFSADEVKFIYTITNQGSNAIEHLQAMISAEKSKMESMIESMLEGAIMLDDQGDVVVLNPQARDMVGLDPKGEVASSDLQEKMKLVNLDAALEESRSKDTVVVREVIMPHNERRILSCTISPVGSKEEKVGTAVILRDVTREKEVDAMKTEFISMVSHELRTPLSITKEGLNLILDKVAGDITEKQEMILKAAKDNMDRLARLINNVLDVSKMEAGKMETIKERLNIVQLAEQVMATFAMKAKEKDIDLRVRFSGKNIDVFADRDKMIQVFTNLVNNALKFTLEGSIEISGKIQGDCVECVVADTGIGISKKDLARTFVKFQQFGRDPGSGEKGTGLGLTIARGIVEMHDGKIWVESEIGVGTKFILTLPKFSPELPLKAFVENGIKEAQRSNTRMSLLAMTLSEAKDDKKLLSKARRMDYLTGMEKVLKEGIHRQGDAVFRDTKGCFVTLTNCSKEHIDSVCGRFKKALDGYLAREQLADTVALKVGSATYPSDARNSEELLKKATEA